MLAKDFPEWREKRSLVKKGNEMSTSTPGLYVDWVQARLPLLALLSVIAVIVTWCVLFGFPATFLEFVLLVVVVYSVIGAELSFCLLRALLRPS